MEYRTGVSRSIGSRKTGVLLIAGMVLSAGGLAACGSGPTGSAQAGTSTSATTATTVPPTTTSTQPPGTDIMDGEGFRFSVTASQSLVTELFNDVIAPPGKQYVIVKFSVRSLQTDRPSVAPMSGDFNVYATSAFAATYSDQGFQCATDIPGWCLVETEEELGGYSGSDSPTLAPGASAGGSFPIPLAVTSPIPMSDIEIVYDPEVVSQASLVTDIPIEAISN